MLRKYLWQKYYKWVRTKGHKKHFTWTGKMLIPVDRNELCIYNVMPRAPTEKAIQIDTRKNTIDKPK